MAAQKKPENMTIQELKNHRDFIQNLLVQRIAEQEIDVKLVDRGDEE